MTSEDTAVQNTPLRLQALGPEDLPLMAACLQDAALRVGDMRYEQLTRRFAFVANRYVWEAAGRDRSRTGLRVRSGAHFNGVVAAQMKGFQADDPDQVLSLLTLSATPDGEDIWINLVFAGNAAIRLRTEYVDAKLTDLTSPWQAQRRPNHDLTSGDKP